ncbi:EMB2076 [Symbiodinium sp. CCMP2592]|nr:EMB2076 [Symbiodinium sp. CCMP2592]
MSGGARPRNVVAANKAIAGARTWRLALHRLGDFRILLLEKDAISFNSAIGGCRASWRRAGRLLGHAVDASLADSITFSATIASLPSWRLALTLLTEALLLPSLPGERFFSSVVNSAAALSSGLRTASGQWFDHPIRWKTSLGLLRAAEKLNIELDVASHNIRLGFQTKAADWQAAFVSFSDMSRCFLTPDNISSSTLFQKLPWAACFCILSERLSAGLRPSESVLKALADALEPQRLWQVALELLDGRRHQVHIGPMTRLHNGVLNTCAAAARWEEALQALGQTRGATELSFLPTISATARQQEAAVAQQLLSEMQQRSLQRTAETFTSAMGATDDTWGRSSSHLEAGWPWALQMMQDMVGALTRVDAVAMNVPLNKCVRAQSWAIALGLADAFRTIGVLATAVTDAALVMAHAVSDLWQRSVTRMGSVKHRSVVTLNPLLDACGRGAWEVALGSCQEAGAARIRLDTISVNSAISACAAVGKWLEASSLLRCAGLESLQADAWTVDSLISAAGTDLVWDVTVDLLVRSRNRGIEPGLAGAAASVDACCHSTDHGSWAAGLRLGAWMFSQRLEPHAMSQSLLLMECEQRGASGPERFLLQTQVPRFRGTDGAVTRVHMAMTPAAMNAYTNDNIADVAIGVARSEGSVRHRRSIDSGMESSDDEERVSYSFPGERIARFSPSFAGSPYRDPATESKAPESDEKGLFSFASKLFEMLGVPLSQPEAPKVEAKGFTPSETAIIFDWDDTLFPTWHALEVKEHRLPGDKAFRDSLDQLTNTVRDLLTQARACGRVAIVTLSRRPWVAESAAEFMPSLKIEALLDELQIPLIYSRECVKKHHMRSPDGEFEEGVCPLTMAKEQAMKKVLKRLYGKNPWKNVLSIGDSVTEKDAITELHWAIMGEDSKSCCKTLKMLHNPTLAQLQMELTVIKDALPNMAKRAEDFTWAVDEQGLIGA